MQIIKSALAVSYLSLLLAVLSLCGVSAQELSYADYVATYRAFTEIQLKDKILQGSAPSRLKSFLTDLLSDTYSGTLSEYCPIKEANYAGCHPELKIKNFLSDFLDKDLMSQILMLNTDFINVFEYRSNSDYELYRLLFTLAEKFRESIQYPMKSLVDTKAFFRAIFSEVFINYARPDNLAQYDLGEYGGNRTVVNAVRQLDEYNKIMKYKRTTFTEWQGTGIYAAPGQVIKVKRLDSGTFSLSVRVGILRNTELAFTDPAAKVDKNGYKYPMRLTSTELKITENNKEYSFSTPTGGPIFIAAQLQSDEDMLELEYSLEINGGKKDIFINQFDDESIAQFKTHIENSPLNWVNIQTDYSELHYLKSSFISSVGYFNPATNDSYTVDDFKKYTQEMNKYLIIGNYNYCGYYGEGLSLNKNVKAWCEKEDINCVDKKIHRKPRIQHVNIEFKPACGVACSGNPFDTKTKNLQPYDWGGNHEMGHNLPEFKLYGIGEIANNIYPLQTVFRYMYDHGLKVGWLNKRPRHQDAFTFIQRGINQSIPPSVKHPLWDVKGYSSVLTPLALHQQLVYLHRDWNIWTKAFILARLYKYLAKKKTNWDAEKSKYGFSDYSLDEIKNIPDTDVYAILISKVTKKSHVAYLEAYGVFISQKAKNQISSESYPESVPLKFYVFPDDMLPIFPTQTVDMDGVTAWPDHILVNDQIQTWEPLVDSMGNTSGCNAYAFKYIYLYLILLINIFIYIF